MTKQQPSVFYLSRIDRNIGDRESAVYLRRAELNALCSHPGMVGIGGPFFDGPHFDFTEPDKWPRKADIAYVGGGGLVGPEPFELGWQALIEREITVVAWAIGHNFSKHQPKDSRYNKLKVQENVFVRERCDCSGQLPVPCPSLLADKFSTPPEHRKQ